MRARQASFMGHERRSVANLMTSDVVHNKADKSEHEFDKAT
jgi:hypothetical protein